VAIRWLARHPDGQIRRLAVELGLSERHFHRQFSAAVGYGPKLLQRIVRFQRFLELAGRPGAPGLAMLAADLGYADQAHLHRECREFSGRSPSQLLADSHCALAMSDLFNTDRRA
jgi:AraC-like DNA-binding protein